MQSQQCAVLITVNISTFLRDQRARTTELSLALSWCSTSTGSSVKDHRLVLTKNDVNVTRGTKHHRHVNQTEPVAAILSFNM